MVSAFIAERYKRFLDQTPIGLIVFTKKGLLDINHAMHI